MPQGKFCSILSANYACPAKEEKSQSVFHKIDRLKDVGSFENND